MFRSSCSSSWGRLGSAGVRVLVFAAVALAVPAASAGGAVRQATSELWDSVPGEPSATHRGAEAAVQPERFRSFRLDGDGLAAALDAAPGESAFRARQLGKPLEVSLPAPNGGFQRFAVEESPVMELELAAKHPELKTYSGRGIDDPAATIRADMTPLGFHASIRSPNGAWYIDPYYHLDDSLYVSYYGRDLVEDPHGSFVEREEGGTDAADALFDQELASLDEGPIVKLRTYRLALVSDPAYANFFGGPGNVTAAKVTLVNRVTQIYEDEVAIRLVLIGENDLLNLNTTAAMVGPNGPCGAAPCYTPAQASTCAGATLTRNRIVIGQIVGASDYDIGHIGLGVPGGGVASLGVVGGNGKAQGCTGLSTPVGDFFAVDYVAHEMGHQFAGNHTFNGTQLNCSGGNRNAANSVEPGSGSSIMAYAGICQQDNLQPHSDPYLSQRTFSEYSAFINASLPPINEVQTASLRDFGGGNEVQTVALSGFGGTDSFRLQWGGASTVPIVRGTNYSADAIKAAIEAIAGWPAGATATVTNIGGDGGTLADAGFDVTFGGTLENTDVDVLAVVNPVGCTASVFEAFDGSPTPDSFALSYGGAETGPIVAGAGYTLASIQEAIQGRSEEQAVSLTGYDTDGDSFRLSYKGADTVPIVRGANNTLAGIQNALQGGNEQQQVTLTGFDAASQSFQVQIAGVELGRAGRRRPGDHERRRRGRRERDPGLCRHRDRERGGQQRVHADVRGRIGRRRRSGDHDRQLHRRLRRHGPRDGKGRQPGGGLALGRHRRREHAHRRRLYAHLQRRASSNGRQHRRRDERRRRRLRDRRRDGDEHRRHPAGRCDGDRRGVRRRRRAERPGLPGDVRRRARRRRRLRAETDERRWRLGVHRRDRPGRAGGEPGLYRCRDGQPCAGRDRPGGLHDSRADPVRAHR